MNDAYDVVRNSLQTLLQEWQAGRLSERRVHEEAESLLDQVPDLEFPRTDARSIVLEVLATLENLNNQWVTTQDVPMILAFLNASSGTIKDAWAIWQRYWDELDYEKRASEISSNPYYSQAGPFT